MDPDHGMKEKIYLYLIEERKKKHQSFCQSDTIYINQLSIEMLEDILVEK
jgi:hypothetical protein